MALFVGWAALAVFAPALGGEKGSGYEACLDELFLIEGKTQDLERRHRIMVTVRFLDNRSEREVQLTLAKKSDSSPAVAILMEADESSVYEQLEQLQEQFPDRPAEELCRKVKVGSRSLSATQEPHISELLEEFENLRVPLDPPSDLIIHGVAYDFWTWSGFGRSHYRFYGFGWPAPEHSSQHPLELWVQRALQVLDPAAESAEGEAAVP